MLPRRPSKLKLSFDTVFYYVTDMDTSIAFYRDTLGLPMVSRDYVARFDLDGVLIELVPFRRERWSPAVAMPASAFPSRICSRRWSNAHSRHRDQQNQR